MERHIQLILMFLREELTPETEKELQAWREADPRNEKFFLHNTNEENLIREWRKVITPEVETGIKTGLFRAIFKRSSLLERLYSRAKKREVNF